MPKPSETIEMNGSRPIVPRETAARARKGVRRKESPGDSKHGLYSATFTASERRLLDALPPDALGLGALASGSQDEKNLLRVKILRLAKLIPLKKISDKELDALIKLVRVVAALDALERTQVMVRKADSSADPVLQALAEMDPEDL
jgi:hypothetical protein